MGSIVGGESLVGKDSDVATSLAAEAGVWVADVEGDGATFDTGAELLAKI